MIPFVPWHVAWNNTSICLFVYWRPVFPTRRGKFQEVRDLICFVCPAPGEGSWCVLRTPSMILLYECIKVCLADLPKLMWKTQGKVVPLPSEHLDVITWGLGFIPQIHVHFSFAVKLIRFWIWHHLLSKVVLRRLCGTWWCNISLWYI